jgi:hypothetical protein
LEKEKQKNMEEFNQQLEQNKKINFGDNNDWKIKEYFVITESNK